MTSWITFNCHRLKGPPFSEKPILFAGTWKRYSKKATPQLIRTTTNKLTPTSLFISFNFKCPYQASVIKTLEIISNIIGRMILFILIFFRLKNIDPFRNDQLIIFPSFMCRIRSLICANSSLCVTIKKVC